MRYSLIRTSINSLSANYGPSLVARAMELGMWTVERALSMIEKIPSPAGKVKMYVAILAKVEPDESQYNTIKNLFLHALHSIESPPSGFGRLYRLCRRCCFRN